MATFDPLKETGFHDSSLVGIAVHDGEVHLYVESLFDGQDIAHSAHVVVENVDLITRNGVAVDSIAMKMPDGQIYSLHEENSGMTLDVIWSDYSSKEDDFCSYVMKGENVRLSVYDVKPIEQ